MSSVLLAPHQDDESLFAAFTIMRARPKVVVVFGRAVLQHQLGYDATARERKQEFTEAVSALLGGEPYELAQWDYVDADPDWEMVISSIESLERIFEQCYAPAVLSGGQEQHNRVGEIARDVFGDRCVGYLTYANGGIKARDGIEVMPEPWMITRKLAALSCYRSQTKTPSAKHFMEDLREYVAR